MKPARLERAPRSSRARAQVNWSRRVRGGGSTSRPRSTSARRGSDAPRVGVRLGPGGERDAAGRAAARGASRAARARGRPSACSPSGTSTPSRLAASRSMLVSASICLKRTLVDAELLGAALGGLEHLGREVRADQRAAGLRSARRRAARCRRCRRRARAACSPGCGSIASIIHAETGIVRRAQLVAPGLPARGLVGPALAALRAEVVGQRHGATHASAGRRGGPCPTRCAAARRPARTPSGTLKPASRSRQCARSAAWVSSAPARDDHERGDRLAPQRVRAGEDGGLDHVRVLGQHGLDLGGRDVLPARDDHVALAAVTISRPSLVEPAEVAGAQAAERVDGAAGDEDLAVGGDRDADARQRAARGLEVARLGDGDRRARLREPVARADRERRRRARARSSARGIGPPPSRIRRSVGPGRRARVEQPLELGRDERGDRDAAVAQLRARSPPRRTAAARAPRSSPSAPSAARPSARRRARAAAGTASARRRRAPSPARGRGRWRGCCRT